MNLTILYFEKLMDHIIIYHEISNKLRVKQRHIVLDNSRRLEEKDKKLSMSNYKFNGYKI